MAFGMDLQALDLRTALDFAVGIEEDSQLRYQDLAARVADPAVRQMFLELARSEADHQRQLEARRAVLFRHAPARFDGSILERAEPPGAGEISVPVSASEALALAMQGEERTGTFYAMAIPHLQDPDVRSLFQELERQEGEHHAALRKRLDELSSCAVGAGGRGRPHRHLRLLDGGAARRWP